MICHEKYLHRDPLAIISNKGGNIHIHATIGALVFIVAFIQQGVFWLCQKQKPVSEFANHLELQKKHYSFIKNLGGTALFQIKLRARSKAPNLNFRIQVGRNPFISIIQVRWGADIYLMGRYVGIGCQNEMGRQDEVALSSAPPLRSYCRRPFKASIN